MLAHTREMLEYQNGQLKINHCFALRLWKMVKECWIKMQLVMMTFSMHLGCLFSFGINEVVRQISQLHKYHLDLRHASVDE